MTYYRTGRPTGRPHRFKVAQVAEALRQGAGVPSLAARFLQKQHPEGCARQTIVNYMARYPQLRAIADEMVETTLDLCESKLLTAINEGEQWAIRLYVMTKGKNRGYTLRSEIVGSGGRPIEVTDARDKLIAELDQMGERLAAAGAGELRSIAGGTPGPGRSNGAGADVAETVEH